MVDTSRPASRRFAITLAMLSTAAASAKVRTKKETISVDPRALD
jgi:hypothetical protein